MKLSTNSLLLRLLEIILGGVFVYAGYLKLLHPEEFAEAVQGYQLVPLSLVGAVAAALPWTELAAGLFLAVGLKRRSCLLLVGSLTGLFFIVMVFTLTRGLKIDCGCGLFSGRSVGLVPILEDGLIFLGAAGLYYWELLTAGEGAAGSAQAKKPALQKLKIEN